MIAWGLMPSLDNRAPTFVSMKKNGPSHLRIVVESGSDFGEEFTFVAGDEFIIGRGRYCNIVIDDKGASRKHTQIVCVERELILRDLDSSNGTFVNGERIIERKLIDQDVVEIVDLRLRAVYIKRGVKPVFPHPRLHPACQVQTRTAPCEIFTAARLHQAPSLA